MQCKDIPEEPILRFLLALDGRWGNWFGDSERSVLHAMPGVPPKLALAKMAQMIRKGIVSGCSCGCRGDFEITEKGKAILEASNVEN